LKTLVVEKAVDARRSEVVHPERTESYVRMHNRSDNAADATFSTDQDHHASA
jgi:hypothetical protein